MSILEKLKEGVLTGSPEEMRAVAAEFATKLPENATVELRGDLGAGKTVFVKGMAKAWKIEEPVTSPSFTIFSLYQGTRNLLHVDAYRLESPGGIETLMIEDFFQPPYCLAVEWPEKVGEWLPSDSWKLSFAIEEDGRHSVRLENSR